MEVEEAFCTRTEREKLLDFGWTKMNQKIQRLHLNSFRIYINNFVFLFESMASNNRINQ